MYAALPAHARTRLDVEDVPVYVRTDAVQKILVVARISLASSSGATTGPRARILRTPTRLAASTSQGWIVRRIVALHEKDVVALPPGEAVRDDLQTPGAVPEHDLVRLAATSRASKDRSRRGTSANASSGDPVRRSFP